MKSTEIPKYALIGGPCSGKTTIAMKLHEEQLARWRRIPESNDKHMEVWVCREAWDLIGSVGLAVIDLSRDQKWKEKYSPQEIKSCLWESILNRNLPHRDGQPENIIDIWRSEDGITLEEVESILKINLLGELIGNTAPTELRTVLQREILRTALIEEQRLIKLPGGIVICDGSLIYPLIYWSEEELPFRVYQDLLKEFGITNIDNVEDIFGYYKGIIFLETLACLPDGKFENYFNNGRRLDPIKHAREIDIRIKTLTQGMDNILFLPAMMNVKEKIQHIKHYLKIEE